MARVLLLLLFIYSSGVLADNGIQKTITESIDDLEAAVDEINEQYEQCEELYETIRNSECANTIFGIFGKIYLKLGVSFTERQLKFQETSTEKDTFILSSGLKPRPIFSIALQDSYFSDSHWGWGIGFNYFDDYAFEQTIQRGSGEDNRTSVDLGTYSSMNVIAVNPTIFYAWGLDDSSPNRYLKIGLGANLMYSAVRGTAFVTEDETDTACYDQGTALVRGTSTDLQALRDNCVSVSYDESSYGAGSKIFLAGEWNKWESELSVSVYNHRSQGDYRFVTQEVMLAFSRKFEF